MALHEQIETLQVLRKQEEQAYTPGDWLSMRQPLHLEVDDVVDYTCRYRTAKWFLQVVDTCNFHSETAEIALNYVDRYLCTAPEVRLDRRTFQLVTITALYSAIKIHEESVLAPQLLTTLSRGAYTTKDIETMESRLLEALDWRMNPPTSMSFVRLLLQFVPTDMLPKYLHPAATDLARLQTELSICRNNTDAASTVAFAALCNTLECMKVDPKSLQRWSRMLQDSLKLPSVDSTRRIMLQALGSDDTEVCKPTKPKFERPASLRSLGRRKSLDESPRGITEAI